jgi:hypothetical protein
MTRWLLIKIVIKGEKKKINHSPLATYLVFAPRFFK